MRLKGRLWFDGGFGSMVQQQLAPGEAPEVLVLRDPDAVERVHSAYLEAGADVVETDTLGANRAKLASFGLTPEQVIPAAVGCARRAVKGCGREAFAALSLGPVGCMVEPLGPLSFREARELFREAAQIGADAGADCILLETFTDLNELRAAVLGAKEAGIPVGATVTFGENGRTLTGADPFTCGVLLDGLGVDFLGMNCGLGPDRMACLVPEMARATGRPLLVNPNAGLPVIREGRTVYPVGPGEFASGTAQLIRLGADLIGGCCGTTPEHIRALTGTCGAIGTGKPEGLSGAWITSASRRADLSDLATEVEEIGSEDPEELSELAMESEAQVLKLSCTHMADALRILRETELRPLWLTAERPEDLEEALAEIGGHPAIGPAGSPEWIRTAERFGALAVNAKGEPYRPA